MDDGAGRCDGATGAASCSSPRSLLAVWFVVTFVVAFFARDLQFTVLG